MQGTGLYLNNSLITIIVENNNGDLIKKEDYAVNEMHRWQDD